MNTSTILITAGLGLGLTTVALALGLPRGYTVERSARIDAPPEAVFAILSRLETRRAWSAWYEKEPHARTEFSGESGAVGATMRWDGEAIGRGSVTIVGLEPNRRVETRLALEAPVAMQSSDALSLERDGMGTRVTWRNQGALSGPMRLMGPLMDHLLGADYDRGLARLKALVERGA